MESRGESGKLLRACGGVGGHRGQLVDAVVGDEFAVDSAGQNYRASVGVILDAPDQIGQLLGHRRRHVIHRRIRHRPDLDVFVLLDFEVFHNFSPQAREYRRLYTKSSALRKQM